MLEIVECMDTLKFKREILQGAEYKNGSRLKLFVLLLFMAADSDCVVDGVALQRGQVVSSVASLSQLSALTVKQVRCALAALAKAGLITTTTTRMYTIVSICNYDSYIV